MRPPGQAARTVCGCASTRAHGRYIRRLTDLPWHGLGVAFEIRVRRFVTVLVDLERRRVVDLLPDREAATLAVWLRARPGVQVVSRDRAGAYPEAAALGAPGAVHAAVPPLERPAPVPSKRGGPVSRRTPQPPAYERAKAATRDRRLARYEQVVALFAQGLP